MLNDLVWLWQVSKPVCEGAGVRALRGRLAFMAKATGQMNSLRTFIHPKPGSPLQRLIAHRPEVVGAVVWPYQCLSWDATTRLNRIEEHFTVIETLAPKLDFPTDGTLRLLDLGDLLPRLHLVLDQPRWFMREGQLVMNLFLTDLRIYSLAFSFTREAGQITACVGAIQGGNVDGILDEYRDMTKTLHGMRPRDFLVELFRAFCRYAGVAKILAVADGSRQHRSIYFGDAKASTLSINYDEIWLERGGIRQGPDFFELSLEPQLKGLDDVPSKKRAMYRRRYELLHDLNLRMQAACADFRPSQSASQATTTP